MGILDDMMSDDEKREFDERVERRAAERSDEDEADLDLSHSAVIARAKEQAREQGDGEGRAQAGEEGDD